jgi:hypothetical protein
MTKGRCCTNDHSHVNDLLTIVDLMKTHWGKRTKKSSPHHLTKTKRKILNPLSAC